MLQTLIFISASFFVISCAHHIVKYSGVKHQFISYKNNSKVKEVSWIDVAPIFQKKCVNCHYPEGEAPIDLSSYKKIVSRHAMVRYVIENNLMPPWFVHSDIDFKDDISLTSYEKNMLIKWFTGGFKKSKKTKLFLTKKTVKGVDSPDYSIKLPKPKKIKVTGFIPYHTFIIQTDFLEDKWIKEIEFITKPKVVHHIAFEVFDPQLSVKEYRKLICSKFKSTSACAKVYYVWGIGMKKHQIFHENGIKIPKKSKILIQIHYESIGQTVVDNMTEIRFLFHKNIPENQIINLRLYDLSIKIPPNVSNYKSEMAYPIKEDLLLIGVNSHMHLRGKASTIFLIKPDNKTQAIIDIDPWSFKFQRKYWFKEPIRILKNSSLACINWFNNNSTNVINPNPKQTVLFGRRTTDEMPICSFFLLLPSSKNFLDM